MATRYIIIAFIILQLAGCHGQTIEERTDSKDGYSDDTYCGEVRYHNPNTGTQSSYTLTVKVESNEIVEIDWPNGGKLDEEDFSNVKVNENGNASFTSKTGYEYEVQIIGPSEGCFTNVEMVKQCKGKTKIGNRCRHMTDNANQLCWQHQTQQ
jgi:hypothetical protein